VIGWKVGFGSPESLARLRIDRPLVAPLPAAGVLPTGATVDVSGWTSPVLEVEIAVHVGHGYGAAIELADVAFPPDDVDRILASGIYHRHVVLGPPTASTIDGVAVRVLRDGAEVAATADPSALTGDLDFVLEAVVQHAGRPLRDGEVVITGTVVPALPLASGEHWRAEILPLGALELTIADV
jgi:2-keto-4-pentenoate hydratase